MGPSLEDIFNKKRSHEQGKFYSQPHQALSLCPFELPFTVSLTHLGMRVDERKAVLTCGLKVYEMRIGSDAMDIHQQYSRFRIKQF